MYDKKQASAQQSSGEASSNSAANPNSKPGPQDQTASYSQSQNQNSNPGNNQTQGQNQSQTQSQNDQQANSSQQQQQQSPQQQATSSQAASQQPLPSSAPTDVSSGQNSRQPYSYDPQQQQYYANYVQQQVQQPNLYQQQQYNAAAAAAAAAGYPYNSNFAQNYQPGLYQASAANMYGYAPNYNQQQLPQQQLPPQQQLGVASGSNINMANIRGGFQSASAPPLVDPNQLPQRPKLTTTYWEDENTVCYQVESRGISVSRREDTNFINGTKLLNVAGMTRGRRDGILKSEKIRYVVKIGAMNLKGVWIPFERALELARNEGIVDLLYPLFVKDIKELYQGPQYSGGLTAAANSNMKNMIPVGLGGNPYAAAAAGATTSPTTGGSANPSANQNNATNPSSAAAASAGSTTPGKKNDLQAQQIDSLSQIPQQPQQPPQQNIPYGSYSYYPTSQVGYQQYSQYPQQPQTYYQTPSYQQPIISQQDVPPEIDSTKVETTVEKEN